MKKLKIKRSVANKYLEQVKGLEDRFFDALMALEDEMKAETGIKDIEFFLVEGSVVGIGTPGNPGKMKLVHRH